MTSMTPDENRIFTELTKDLAADPTFSSPRQSMALRGVRRKVMASVGVVVGLVAILAALSLLDGWLQIIGGVAGFGIMIAAGMRWPTSAELMDSPNSGRARAVPAKPQSEFMANLERKWEERRKNEGLN